MFMSKGARWKQHILHAPFVLLDNSDHAEGHPPAFLRSSHFIGCARVVYWFLGFFNYDLTIGT